MSEFNEIFADLNSTLKELSRRVTQFETWEPSTGLTDVSAHAYRTSNVAVTSGGYTTVAFNGELYDTDSINTSGTLTIPADGKYFIKGGLFFSSFSGNVILRITKSATEYASNSYSGTVTATEVSATMLCSEGDTITLDISPSVNVTILGVTNYYYVTFFQIRQVG